MYGLRLVPAIALAHCKKGCELFYILYIYMCVCLCVYVCVGEDVCYAKENVDVILMYNVH